jgi:hypothetical protein
MTDPSRRKLEHEILAWMREGDWREDEARFERLALALFAVQFERCVPFRRFCEGRNRTPVDIRSWREIPRVPTAAFKEVALRSFPAERTVHTFRTSGTSTATRGVLHLDTLELYEASLLPSFRNFVLPDLAAGQRSRLLVLAPSAQEAPDSSLSHMFSVAMRELGTPDSACSVEGGELRAERLLEHLEPVAASDAPLALCGTAFSFVHLLDAMERRAIAFALPESTRVMETGGFKGRSREVSREQLYALIEGRLGIPAQRIVNQYGMTELGSQFYDSVLRRPDERRHKLGPPWARVVIVDPETDEPAATGEVGAIAVIDLANTGSVLALQTEDLGREIEGGFEVLGRAAGTDERGCSIAADALLAGPPT